MTAQKISTARATKLTRGEANNNPGNIIFNPANDWVGQTGIEPPCAGGATPRFACFDTPVNGGRAIAVLLQTYQAKGFRTVRGLIERWAPPSENNSAAYVAAVARAVGVDPDAEIDVKDYRVLRPLLEAIIQQENGRVIYSNAQLDEMLRRGGVTKPGTAEVPLPPVPPPVKSAGLAATSALAAPGVGLATVASDPALREAVQASGVPWLILTVSFLGIAATAYLLWHTLRKQKPEAAT